MNREAWNVAVRGAAKSRTWLSGWTKLITFCNRPYSFLFWLLHTHSQFFVKFPMITAWHRLILLTFQKNYIYMWSLLTSASQVAQWLKKKKKSTWKCWRCTICHSIPGSGRPPGAGNGSLQYPCLENSMDRGAWWDWEVVYLKYSDSFAWILLENNNSKILKTIL